MKLVARVKSSKDPTLHYEVRMAEDGALSCSCPGFTYRRQCKHTNQFRQQRPDVIRKARHDNSERWASEQETKGRYVRGLPKPCTHGGEHLFVYLGGSLGERGKCWHCGLIKEPTKT